MKVKTFSLAVALIIAGAACSPAQDTPATVQAGVAATLTALLTATPADMPTPTPTYTPVPVATPTPQPTLSPTPLPTSTPTPTATPLATFTPTRTPTPTPIPSTTPVPYLTYNQLLYKWYIRYPSDWTVTQQTLPQLSVVFKPPQGFAELRVTTYKGFGKNYDTQSWYQASLQTFQAMGDSVLATKATSVSSRPAFEVQRQALGTFTKVTLVFVEGLDAYWVEATSASENWAVWRPILESLVYTFGFSTTAGATTTIPTATPSSLPVAPICSPAIESQIDGTFEGWTGDTVFKLTNGQVWQQAEYAYTYHYAYRPRVTIFSASGGCKMQVEGVSTSIRVRRLG